MNTNTVPSRKKQSNLNRKVIGGNWLSLQNQIGTSSSNSMTMNKTKISKSSNKKFMNFIEKIPETDGKITNCLALDCEMVGIGINGSVNMLARVSIINEYLEIVLDKYVKPREKVTDYRTWVSGIRPKDMEMGEDFDSVQKLVTTILKGKIIVGHGLKQDFEVLLLNHPKHLIRDTSRYKYFRKNFGNSRTPSLKYLAKHLCGIDIQTSEHSSVEDARAVMQVYNQYKQQWEKDMRNSRKRHD